MKRAVRLFFFAFVASLPVFGQTSGEITGEVKDFAGAVVVGTKVTVTNAATSATRETVTTGAGVYSFPAMQPGVYDIKVEHPGFRRSVRNAIELQVQQTARVDFVLEVGQVNESIQVTGSAVMLNTPALQTNFSPASTAFGQQAYLDLATLLVDAGQIPYLQFGEVQWWYFPDDGSGMPFYDAYTTSTFAATYGHAMHVFANSNVSPALYPDEAAFLPALIGAFTSAVMSFVRETFPSAKFEVLYPPDVNDFTLTRVVNLPGASWSPANLDVFKTEKFTYTGARNLNKAKESILLPLSKGFSRGRTAHLVGVHNSSEPWDWERRLAEGKQCESIVLFAFDQLSMIGYRLPLGAGERRSAFQG